MKLRSDFVDYYDHAFSNKGKVFNRKSTIGPDRREMLFMMHHLGLKVPTHGLVKELYTNLLKNFSSAEEFKASKVHDHYKVVVYHDIKAHRGDGKSLMTATEANEKYPDAYGSQYLPSRLDKPKSWRYLAIGHRHFWMEFTSNDTWRSNAGEVDIKMFTRPETEQADRVYGVDLIAKGIKLPLFAIDFVPPSTHGSSQHLTAVDFNVSPGLRGTPVENELDPSEVASLIEEYGY